MNRKLFFAILILLVPSIVSAQNFGNVLKDTIQKKIPRPVGQGYAITLSEFRIAQSQGKYYWFIKVTNNSNMVIPRGNLKVQASQYDTQGNTQAAGIPIESNLQINPNRNIQLQREFIPMPGLTSILVKAYQKDINKRILSQRFAATIRPDMPGVKPVEKQLERKVIYSVETPIMIDGGDFYLLIRNRGNNTINANDFTVQTRWEHVFKPDTIEEEKTLPDSKIQSGKYYSVRLTAKYIYKYITDKKIIVTIVNHKENKTYTAEKAIVPPKFTLDRPIWYDRSGHELEDDATLPSSGRAALFVNIKNHSPYRISGILTITVIPYNLELRYGEALTVTIKAGEPAIEPFKSALVGRYFDYAWPKKNKNDRAFKMTTEMVMKIPYEPVEASISGGNTVIIKW